MMYSFTCPAPGCGHITTVEANTDDDAVDKFMTAGGEHAKTAHPAMPMMPEEQMRQMVRTGMKKM